MDGLIKTTIVLHGYYLIELQANVEQLQEIQQRWGARMNHLSIPKSAALLVTLQRWCEVQGISMRVGFVKSLTSTRRAKLQHYLDYARTQLDANPLAR